MTVLTRRDETLGPVLAFLNDLQAASSQLGIPINEAANRAKAVADATWPPADENCNQA